MPLTHFPNGVSTQASSASSSNAGVGDLDCVAIHAVNGSVFGARVPLAFGGSAVVDLYTIGITSALYDSGTTLRAPFKCVAELIHVQGGTTGINRVVRVTATSVSTGAAVTTLTVASVSNGAAAINTTIGTVSLGQGSFFSVTSAVTATANTAEIMLNLIPVA